MPEIIRPTSLAPQLFSSVVQGLRPESLAHITGSINCRIPGFNPRAPHLTAHFRFDPRARVFVPEIRASQYANGGQSVGRNIQMLGGQPPEVVVFQFGGERGDRTVAPLQQFMQVAFPPIQEGRLVIHQAALGLVTPSSPPGTLSRLRMVTEGDSAIASLTLDPNLSRADDISLREWFKKAEEAHDAGAGVLS